MSKANQGLSSREIMKILQNEKDFKGCFMRGEKLSKNGCFVSNLDEITDPEAHEYYDSLGLPSPKSLDKTINWYNTRQHENVNCKLCGMHACYYIH